MDIVVILTVVIPAVLVAMGFYFFVICVVGVNDDTTPSKAHQSRQSQVVATYWGRYHTPNACIKPPKETISLPKITPLRESSIHVDPNWN